MTMDFSPFWISIKVAACATAITFAAGLAAARLVMLMKRGKGIVDGLFSLPMVLPPTVVGFFLLMIFGAERNAGQFTCLHWNERCIYMAGSRHRRGGCILSHNVQDRKGRIGTG